MANADRIDAGELREKAEVLELERAGGVYRWSRICMTWARADLSTRKNVWSTHGIGAAGVTFILRRLPLTLSHAMRWRGQHCFITSIQPLGRNYLKVEAALVEVSNCLDKYTGTEFPGIVTEKYLRHEQLEPHAINTLCHVLVTPKSIVLKPGNLVEVNGESWPIRVAHLLDPQKNEYEIERVADL